MHPFGTGGDFRRTVQADARTVGAAHLPLRLGRHPRKWWSGVEPRRAGPWPAGPSPATQPPTPTPFIPRGFRAQRRGAAAAPPLIGAPTRKGGRRHGHGGALAGRARSTASGAGPSPNTTTALCGRGGAVPAPGTRRSRAASGPRCAPSRSCRRPGRRRRRLVGAWRGRRPHRRAAGPDVGGVKQSVVEVQDEELLPSPRLVDGVDLDLAELFERERVGAQTVAAEQDCEWFTRWDCKRFQYRLEEIRRL